MTLYRQMLIFTSALFCILFASSLFIKLQSTRTFLQDQLESHAQDTATSLGLSILPHISDNDMATVDTMLNAVFDRGYYRKIFLRDLEGKTLVERKQEVVISEVPAWFIKAIPLATPEAETLITSGWQQFGHLHVESHPGYAYKTLWQTAVDMTKVFGIIAALVLASGALGLRLLLRPLRQVELQAEDLCKRQYRFQTKLPRTRELRRVVVAMNSMTRKIKEMFDEQAQIADNLRKSSYSDTLTGLGNRRYLEGQVTAGMEQADAATVRGAFLLLQVNNLLELNQSKGYQYSDLLLQRIAACIRTATGHLPNAALARISGGSFAIFLPNTTGEEAGHIAGEITKGVGGLAVEDVGYPSNLCHLGGVHYQQATGLGELLSTADRIVSAAKDQGPNSWIVEPLAAETTGIPRGEQAWLAILDRILADKDIAVFGQTTVQARDRHQPLHLELFARITLEGGQILSAGVFIPLAERLQRIAAIDRIILEKALQLQAKDIRGNEVAVNISTSSLRDTSFITWIYGSLKSRPPGAPQIIFEFAEFNATQELALLQDFTKEVKALGHFIGLDHFGQSFANFGYLKSLQPKYVKIDRAFTDELKTADSNSQFFIGSLTSVAHSLDILVIAEGVEEEKQYQILKDLNIDGIQGYFIDKPSQLAI
ncbi:MAG: EAL domain-containing protein [Desulforhopalus sp.]|nr:EAL domain-containing protein [Desulforhopalus sp.]